VRARGGAGRLPGCPSRRRAAARLRHASGSAAARNRAASYEYAPRSPHASGGRLLWQRPLGRDEADDFTEIESSPVVASGLVVFGVDVLNHRGGACGGVYALDAASVALRWRFDAEAGRQALGCGDVWSSPAVDLVRRTVYVGIANCYTPKGRTRFTEAMVALDLDTGTPCWSFQPHGARVALGEPARGRSTQR
jgi:outer membrane protein assembly factor BamB